MKKKKKYPSIASFISAGHQLSFKKMAELMSSPLVQ